MASLSIDHPGLASAERLRDLVEAWKGGQSLDGDNLDWLMGSLEQYLGAASDGLKVEDALGVAVPPGGEPWFAAKRRIVRDETIRKLVATFGGAVSAKSCAAAQAIRRYGATGWRHDRARGEPLTSDPRRKLLFAIFSADGNPPTSMRRVHDIVRG